MHFIRNIHNLENSNVDSDVVELEVIADGKTVGEFKFGPYIFSIWELSEKKEGEERKLCLRIKSKTYSMDEESLDRAEKNGEVC